MDIRRSKYSENEQIVVTDEGSEEFLIKTDKALESRRLNESIVYNLVQKIDTIEGMKTSYYQGLVGENSVTSFAKYYIHSYRIEL